MNNLDEELKATLLGERAAVAARFASGHAGSRRPQTATARVPMRQRIAVLAIPMGLAAIVAVFAFSMWGNTESGIVRTAVVADQPTNEQASADEPAPNGEMATDESTPPTQDSPRADGPPPDGVSPESIEPTWTEPVEAGTPIAIANGGEFDGDFVEMRLVPSFLVSGLPEPTMEQFTAISSLSSNSEEIYSVAPDGTVSLPTIRDRDVFTFSAPIGDTGCIWTSNPQTLLALVAGQPGELPVMAPDFSPLCIGSTSLSFDEPTSPVQVRFVDQDGGPADPVQVVALAIRQTTGYEPASSVLVLAPMIDNLLQVFTIEQASLLIATGTGADGCALTGAGVIPAASQRTSDTEIIVTISQDCTSS